MFDWIYRSDVLDALLLAVIAVALLRLRQRARRRQRLARVTQLDRLRVT